MKKVYLSKLTKIFLLSGSLVISASAATTVALLLINKKVEIRYIFNNQEYSGKKEIFDHVYSQAKNTNYSFKNLKYLIDGKVFNSRSDFDEYVNRTYPIESLSTIKNPNDYLISNSGELSPLVLTDQTEKGINIFKGINGNSFLSRKAAQETYFNSYEEKYSVEGHLFDNLYSAQNYYKEVILDRLKNHPEKAIQKVYTHGGIDYEGEKEIKSWLRSTIKRGFEYKGNIFSDYNYPDFENAMQNLDHFIIDDNIRPVMDANKSSYWINHSLTNPFGYFVGPKYIESSENIEPTAKFRIVDSQDVNYFLSTAVLGTLAVGGLIANCIDPLTTNSDHSAFDFSAYLKNIFKNEKFPNLDHKLLDTFDEIFNYSLPQNIREDAAVSLDQITDPEFTNFHRMLVVFKRLLTAAKVYDLPDLSGEKYKEFEQLVKKIVVEILSIQGSLMTNLAVGFSENWKETFLSDEVSFDEIYGLFLNSDQFFNDGGTRGKIFNFIKNGFDVLEKRITNSLEMAGKITKITDAVTKLDNTPEKNENTFKAGSKNIINDATTAIGENFSSITDDLGVVKEPDEASKFIGPAAIIGAISSVWSIGKMASFITFITAEAKIDSNNSIYYFEPTFKIPFLDIIPFPTPVDAVVTTLSEAPVKRLLPKGEDGEDIKVYEFNNQYYINKEIAKSNLITAIYKNPEKYLPSKSLVTSGFGDIKILDLPPIAKNGEDDGKHISVAEYQKAINTAKEEFVDELFNHYHEVDKKFYYSDGFNGWFDTPPEAQASLEVKVDEIENYKRFYAYKINTDIVLKNSKEEILQFIKDNQIIAEKQVINTDLIETMVFDKIKNYYGEEYPIYKVVFYGKNRYFRTKLEAEKFLDNNLESEIYDYNEIVNTYQYEDWDFLSKTDFDAWINQRITEAK